MLYLETNLLLLNFYQPKISLPKGSIYVIHMFLTTYVKINILT